MGGSWFMTTDTISPLHKLTDAQQEAVLPDRNVWLSASAGSGKTQVLSARVIRLLLEDGVRPENLLCLTFTKAAAAEMAERINQRLASWVQAKGDVLKAELDAIGSSYGPEARAKARKLFAQVLDAPGGGLQIMTIHSFCQSLLAGFPEEAGLLPGFEPIDDRAVAELHSDALAELVQAAEKDGRDWLITNLQDLSVALGEDGVRTFLRRCATHGDTLERDVPDDKGALALARRIMDIEFEGTVEGELERRCDDAAIDVQLLESITDMNIRWATATGTKRANIINSWLGKSLADRVAALDELTSCWTTQKGDLTKSGPKKEEAYEDLALAAHQWTRSLVQFRNAAAYAERLAPALITGKAYAAQYRLMKHARGLVDFDDLITNAARLLNQGGIAEWVRYKLDRKIDHILVDEAQDTNDAQWDIIEALSDDFFSGAGAGKERPRTVFAVGDFKQAIYGFQGTAPEKYRDAGDRLQTKIADAGEELHRLTLSQSFRSTRPILDFVNAVADGIGHEALGLDAAVPDHFSEKPDHGTIELMRCVRAVSEDVEGDKDESEEQWLSEEKRKLAHRVAQHVKNLIDAKPVLATTGLPLNPADIMILLRARGELAGLIVARLHALGVPVAGIDRLRIIEPIAVQDLLAAIRFVLQPKDDLSLACLLVSPLLGWDQDRLLKHGYREKHIELWQHLRSQPDIETELEPLRAMLRAADQTTPYAFLENILSGPTGGRRKFQARLGAETLVPIEELLNLAIQYQQEGGASLQGFLDWFDRGEGEIKREGLAQSSDVRVMTVHGAKGLEAPVVILADIASDPDQSGKRNNAVNIPMGNDCYLPLLPIRKHERSGGVEKVVLDKEKADMQEHYRLLYVAMTRASEHLIMAGSLGKRAKNGPPEKSWYAALEAGMMALGCDWQSDPLWGATMRYDAVGAFDRKKQDSTNPAKPAMVPDWLFQPAPEEENPPRPLAPSNLGDDLYGDAPASDALRIAALRGKLIHSLFEQYDGRDLAQFRVDALSWLGRNDRDGLVDHKAAVDQIAAVLGNSDWASLFGKAARAEVPLAALVGTTVISGRVDRLLIEPELVRLVDFKTGRKIPGSQDEIAVPQLRQMAHYVAALEAIFPGRRVEASLLYTAGPAMITLSDAALAPHKPA
jgi:ATP-dependent helicase/nuclease subunit A